MKKIFLIGAVLTIVAVAIFTSSCKQGTSSEQNVMFLQTEFTVVYSIHDKYGEYICVDSLDHVYDIRINYRGQIFSKIKIK
jgi:hypothetical protein